MAFNVLAVVKSDEAGYAKAGRNAIVEGVPAGCVGGMLENRIRGHNSCLAFLGHPSRDFEMSTDPEFGSLLSGTTPVPRPAADASAWGSGCGVDFTTVYLRLLGPRE